MQLSHLDGHFGRDSPDCASVELARDRIARVFVNHRLEVRGNQLPRISHSRLPLASLDINRLSYGCRVEVEASLPDFYLFQITLAGRTIITSSDFEVELRPGSIFVMNPRVLYRKSWSSDAKQLIVKIPESELVRCAGAAIPGSPSRSVRFHPRMPAGHLTHAMLHYIDGLCMALQSSAALPGARSAAEHLEGSLLGTIIRLVPNECLDSAVRAESPAAPFYVRRAEAYMRMQPSRRITMHDLAVQGGVSERSLQEGFRRFRGKSPMQALRDLRLEAVRTALLGGAKTCASVSDAAQDAGFTHMGRFAQSYRDKFGETPSDTLKRVGETDDFRTEARISDRSGARAAPRSGR